MRLAAVMAVLATLSGAALAAQDAKPPAKIEDNSFLIEEAYNQDAGVVQHINTFQRSRNRSWVYTFTQEWPVGGQKNQLSYSVPVLHDSPSGTGVGDVALNYRYQAIGKDEEALWFSPRLSVYLPTGSARDGRGNGGAAVELMLPFSYSASEMLVTHWNISGSVARAADGSGKTGSVQTGRLGASAIVLLSPNINLMLESTLGRTRVLLGGVSMTENAFVISPGIRGALNFASGLQIVPGIAAPIGFGPSDGQRDVLFYLSFEHPFR